MQGFVLAPSPREPPATAPLASSRETASQRSRLRALQVGAAARVGTFPVLFFLNRTSNTMYV